MFLQINKQEREEWAKDMDIFHWKRKQMGQLTYVKKFCFTGNPKI